MCKGPVKRLRYIVYTRDNEESEWIMMGHFKTYNEIAQHFNLASSQVPRNVFRQKYAKKLCKVMRIEKI